LTFHNARPGGMVGMIAASVSDRFSRTRVVAASWSDWL